MELVPELPNEIGLESLMRVPYNCHPDMRNVCRSWREAISSPEFHRLRKQNGHTRRLACFVQSLPRRAETPANCRKLHGPPAYGLSLFDVEKKSWERVEPIPLYPNGLPLFCQLVGVDGKLVVLGGWDPESWESTRGVFVYDFTARAWRRGKDMPAARSFFAAAAVGKGRVYVAGGHDESKNALSSAEVYDVRRDEWETLPRMEEERDECEGMMVGSEFWVVSGYGTDQQGRFVESGEAFEPETRRWRRVEGAWKGGLCPRCCVLLSRNGRLERLEGDMMRGCVVGLGAGRALVMGSAYHGGPQSCSAVEWKGEGRWNWEVVDLPKEFSGFVQSGGSLEV